jgi:Asp-tRNA(Asn)/Glu-tRNA(Gln) amidotransferase A subunit family amidase
MLCGFTASSLPIGTQTIGKVFDAAMGRRIAHADEPATAWHRQQPRL